MQIVIHYLFDRKELKFRCALRLTLFLYSEEFEKEIWEFYPLDHCTQPITNMTRGLQIVPKKFTSVNVGQELAKLCMDRPSGPNKAGS